MHHPLGRTEAHLVTNPIGKGNKVGLPVNRRMKRRLKTVFYGLRIDLQKNPIRRRIMKRNIGPTTLVLLVFAMFVVSMASPSALAQQCSLAGAAGAYGFTGTGTLLLATGAVPIAAVGRLNLRADGTLSGTEARSVGGDFANETLTGT